MIKKRMMPELDEYRTNGVFDTEKFLQAEQAIFAAVQSGETAVRRVIFEQRPTDVVHVEFERQHKNYLQQDPNPQEGMPTDFAVAVLGFLISGIKYRRLEVVGEDRERAHPTRHTHDVWEIDLRYVPPSVQAQPVSVKERGSVAKEEVQINHVQETDTVDEENFEYPTTEDFSENTESEQPTVDEGNTKDEGTASEK